MGFLATQRIAALLGDGLVTPFDPRDVVAGSVDLRLGCRAFRHELPDGYVLGDAAPAEVEEDFSGCTLAQGETRCIGVMGRIAMPTNLLGLLLPRSSITRLGIDVSPVLIQPGYEGTPPLTITNHSGKPVTLRPGVRVAQLALFTAEGAPASYADQAGAKYQGEDVSPSLLHQDYDLDRVNAIVVERFPFMAGKL